MQNTLLLAIGAGLGGMLGWGFADFFAKKTIDEVGDIVSLVWAHLFGTIILIFLAVLNILFLHHPLLIPMSLTTWIGLAFFGVLQAAVYLFAYQGFGKGQLALLNPVFASFPGLTAVMSIVIFGEIVTGHLPLALLTIFIGILLINLDSHALRSKKITLTKTPGLKEIAIAALLAAFWTLFWSKFVGGNDWLSYALFMYAFMTIAVFIYAKMRRVKLQITKNHVYKYLFFIGFCETIAYMSISFGYSMTTFTSIIALISGSFSLPTIILARLFLKEKVTLIQTIGSFVIILGIIFLSLQ